MINENCKFCGKSFKIKIESKRRRSILHHLSLSHPEIDHLDFLIEYENFQIPKCEFCGENCIRKKTKVRFYRTCKKSECIKKSRAHSEENRKKLSEGRLRYLKTLSENPTKYVNRSKESYWEKYFRENVLEKERLFEKYKIVQEYREGTYSLDFAIFGKDRKIDLEIDGQQHFKNEQYMKRDKIRNSYLEIKGWKVYRLSCFLIKASFEKEKERFLEFLGKEIKEDFDQTEYLGRVFKYKELKKMKNEEKKKSKSESLSNKIEKRKLVIINSGIDFSKFGWERKMNKILDNPITHTKKWMKKNMPEFYEEKCFKRKSKGESK